MIPKTLFLMKEIHRITTRSLRDKKTLHKNLIENPGNLCISGCDVFGQGGFCPKYPDARMPDAGCAKCPDVRGGLTPRFLCPASLPPARHRRLCGPG
jgi:hypothetical protein